MGVCNCSMFCCTLLYVHFSIAIILMGKRELIALLNLSSWCLVMVERLFLTVPRGCLQFVIVVFPDHTHLLFLAELQQNKVVCSNIQLLQGRTSTCNNLQRCVFDAMRVDGYVLSFWRVAQNMVAMGWQLGHVQF